MVLDEMFIGMPLFHGTSPPLKNSGIRLYLCITKIIPPYNLFLINQILNLRLNPQGNYNQVTTVVSDLSTRNYEIAGKVSQYIYLSRNFGIAAFVDVIECFTRLMKAKSEGSRKIIKTTQRLFILEVLSCE